MSREMKDSGVEWIGKIPENWDIFKVKNAFDKKNEKAMQDDPIILSLARSGVKIRDISNNEGQLAESYYNYNPVEKGDLLLNPMDLYSGANCSLSEIEGVISPAYVNLKAKKGFNPKYYDYYFKLQYWSMAFFAHGKGVSFDNRWTLNNETLMNYSIPVPSIEVQEATTKYLDEKISEIDNIITQTTLSIKEYKKYKQSLITETVTKGLNSNVEMKDSGVEWIDKIPKEWVIKSIGDFLITLTDYHSNGSYETLRNNVELLNEYNYALMVRTTDLEKNNFINDVKYITKDAYEHLKKSKVFGGEIIINKIGSAGKVYLMPYLDRPVSLAMNQFLLRFNKNVITKYVYYFLMTDFSEKNIAERVKGAVTKTITKDAVRSIPFVLVPLEEQVQISDYLDKKCSDIDNIINQKEQLQKELEAYKKSLIYECVTGKRRVE